MKITKTWRIGVGKAEEVMAGPAAGVDELEAPVPGTTALPMTLLPGAELGFGGPAAKGVRLTTRRITTNKTPIPVTGFVRNMSMDRIRISTCQLVYDVR
jgi:hypothetical protein